MLAEYMRLCSEKKDFISHIGVAGINFMFVLLPLVLQDPPGDEGARPGGPCPYNGFESWLPNSELGNSNSF